MRQLTEGILTTGVVWIISALTVAVYIISTAFFPENAVSSLVLRGDMPAAVLEPWRLASYMLVHLSPLHLVVNMGALIVSGAWFLRHGAPGSLIATFLAGGVAGALAFVVLCSLSESPHIFLAGSSAGICALFGAAAVKSRGIVMHIAQKTIIMNRWWLLSIISIVLVSGVFSLNPGGALAHLAGMSIGIIIASVPTKCRHQNENPIITKTRHSGFASLTSSERAALSPYNSHGR